MAAVALPDWLDFRPRIFPAATSHGCAAPGPSWLTVASALILGSPGLASPPTLRSGAACWQDDRLISTVPHSRVGS